MSLILAAAQGQQQNTTSNGGVRDTSKPSPITYQASALDSLGAAPASPLTYTQVALSTTTSSTWTGATRSAWSSSDMTVLGAIPDPAVTSWCVQQVGQARDATYAVEFSTDAATLGVVLQTYDTTKALVRLWVDGVPHPQQQVNNPTGTFAVRADLGSSKSRKVRVDVRYAHLVGIDRTAGSTIAASPRPATRVLMIGDSYVAAPNAEGTPDTWLIDQFGWLLGPLLGVEAFHSGIGGTGYTAKYPDSHYGAAQRTEMYAKIRPNYAIVFGSQNDGTPDQTTLEARANELYTNLAAYARTFVVGPSHMGSSVMDTMLESITKDATRAPRVFGYTSPFKWTDLDQASTYLEAHLTWRGNVEYAKRIARDFAAAHRAAYPTLY